VGIPANVTATVYVPAKSLGSVTENGRKLITNEGVEVLGQKPGYFLLKVGSGNYTFKSASFTTIPLKVKGVKTPVISPGDTLLPLPANLRVEISTTETGATTHYTLDGTEPTASSIAYTKPFSVNKTTIVKAKSFKGSRGSYTATAKIEAYDSTLNGWKFKYWEGKWRKIPNVDTLGKPRKEGSVPHITLKNIADRQDFWFVEFSSHLKVDKARMFYFSTNSDDGSRISIDGKTIVDNDGLHPARKRYGSIFLNEGLHEIKVDFLQWKFGASLEVEGLSEGTDRIFPVEKIYLSGQ
jgi:hypothetical protein